MFYNTHEQAVVTYCYIDTSTHTSSIQYLFPKYHALYFAHVMVVIDMVRSKLFYHYKENITKKKIQRNNNN